MRGAWSILAVGLLAAMPAVPAFAANDLPVDAPIISCGNGIPGGVYCAPSKKDLKEARNAYERGLKLQDHHQMEQAFAQFDQALRLAPQDVKIPFGAGNDEVAAGVSTHGARRLLPCQGPARAGSG